jgi:hypothetical protein
VAGAKPRARCAAAAGRGQRCGAAIIQSGTTRLSGYAICRSSGIVNFQQRSRRIQVQSSDGEERRAIEAQPGSADGGSASGAQGTRNDKTGPGATSVQHARSRQGPTSDRGAPGGDGHGSLASQSGPGGQTVQSGAQGSGKQTRA